MSGAECQADRQLSAPDRPAGERGREHPPGQPDRSAAAPTGEVAMQTGRSSSRLVALSLAAENEVMQTRSQAPVLRIRSASGRAAGASLTSMLNRTSGQAPRRSSSSGIGSVPGDLGLRDLPWRAGWRSRRPGRLPGRASCRGMPRAPRRPWRARRSPGRRSPARPRARTRARSSREMRRPRPGARTRSASDGQENWSVIAHRSRSSPDRTAAHSRRRASASAIAVAAATFSEPTRPTCGM